MRWALASALLAIQICAVALLPVRSGAAQQTIAVAEAIPGRYIVRLKPTSGMTAASVAASYDAQAGVRVDQIYAHVFSGFAGEFTNQAATRLANDPNVLDVFPDRLSYPAAQRMPPGIARVDADLNPTRAGNGAGSVDADIAVLDTGIYRHPDLNVVGGKDCSRTRRTNQYTDLSGHGTHVAGTAAAIDNDEGVVGIAPGARLWAIKVFSDDGGGAALESEVTCGLDYVRSMAGTIEVINLSIGANYGYDLGGCAATPYHQAYCNVVNSGVTVVVAAQNWTINARTVVPAQFDEVITVSAYYDSDGKRGGDGPDSDCTPLGGAKGIQTDDTFACFSNFGQDIDIAAPGMDVYSTYSPDADWQGDSCPGPNFCYMSGTSMATPHVAGAVALIAAQQGRMSPAATKARLLLAGERGPVPLDRDGIAEPMLNVAQLGAGVVTAPARAKVGDRVTVAVSGFTPGERAIFRLDGIYVGGDTIDDQGRGSRRFTIPEISAELHRVTVSTGQRTLSRLIDINPLIQLDVTSGPVGQTVDVVLRGFGTGESIVVWFDTGAASRSMVRVWASQDTGSADTSFVVPASTYGKHRVSAIGNKSSLTYTTYRTRASVSLIKGTPAAGSLIRVQALGYGPGEVIEARFDTQSGPVLGRVTASDTGSGSLSVRIPANASTGTHYLWLLGHDGHNVRLLLSVTAAEKPVPTPSATASPSPTESASASATPESGATNEPGPPTEEPVTEVVETPMPTRIATAEFTATPTASTTPALTEAPFTATATPERTEEPATGTPTSTADAPAVNNEGT